MKFSNKPLNTVYPLIVLYIALNITFVFQYTLSMITFAFWGGIAPLLATIITWLYMKKHAVVLSSWVKISSILSVVFFICGLSTVYILSAIWASV